MRTFSGPRRRVRYVLSSALVTCGLASLANATSVQQLVPNPSSIPLFRAVAVNSNVVVAGGRYADMPGFFSREGAAVVFDASTGQYLRTLESGSPWQNPEFGCAVDVNPAGRAVVGAYRDRGGPSGAFDYGAAYVYDANTGQYLFRLSGAEQQLNGQFGASVAIGPQYALVGAPWEGGDLYGAVYLFDANNGQQLSRFALSSPGSRATFGSSLAISGSTAVIGAAGGFTISVGDAYLYNLDTRAQIARLVPPDATTGSHFGLDVAISGDRAVVGATEDIDGSKKGSVYVFDASDGAFLRKLTAPDLAGGDQFGVSVALEGEIALVASRSMSPLPYSGAVYVFNVETGQLLDKFQAPTAQQNSDFGWDVDFTGTTAALGTSQSSAYLAHNFLVVPEPTGCLLLTTGAAFALRRRAKSPKSESMTKSE